MVFDLLGAVDLHEDEIDIAAHTHQPPRLIVVVVLLLKQCQSLGDVLVIESNHLLRRHIDILGIAIFELNQSHDAVVDYAHEFWDDALSYQRFALELKASDAVGFDINLIGDRLRTHDTP